MGQAKLRGTREQRIAAAIDRAAEEEALRAAQRAASERLYRATYAHRPNLKSLMALALAVGTIQGLKL